MSTSKIVVVKASVPRTNKQVTVTKVDTVVRKTKKKNRRRLKRTALGLVPGNSVLSNAYAACLANPFTCPPVRAGFGCMVPSQIHTAYLRTSFTTLDGSFNLFILPNQNNLMLTNYNGLNNNPIPVPFGGSTYLNPANNYAALNAVFNSSRTLAMGIRLIPMIPATSSPGIISMGCAPRAALIDLIAPNNSTAVSKGLFNASTATISGLPYLREHMARPGGADYFQCTWRPTDVRDFEFSDGDTPIVAISGLNAAYSPFYNSQTSLTNTLDTQGSFLVIAGVGMPSSTQVYVEVILHMETTTTTNTITNVDTATVSPSIADEGNFPTMESLYRRVAPFLPSVETVAGAATSLMSSPAVASAVSRYARQNLLGVRSSGFELV